MSGASAFGARFSGSGKRKPRGGVSPRLSTALPIKAWEQLPAHAFRCGISHSLIEETGALASADALLLLALQDGDIRPCGKVVGLELLHRKSPNCKLSPVPSGAFCLVSHRLRSATTNRKEGRSLLRVMAASWALASCLRGTHAQ
jgi:hypothetical protein